MNNVSSKSLMALVLVSVVAMNTAHAMDMVKEVLGIRSPFLDIYVQTIDSTGPVGAVVSYSDPAPSGVSTQVMDTSMHNRGGGLYVVRVDKHLFPNDANRCMRVDVSTSDDGSIGGMVVESIMPVYGEGLSQLHIAESATH